ncbi:GFA family protein [Peteryoungia desertarenae]|uniref:GFA family protein n=1 Tax=Peteryoungia desertarenae TaxID=1813451 RepID=A0ABX6QQG0_9HYPH|nr:GFA family protein [Peteryoungia desertarenae]QLF70724.1 GFA family protein [Peteryoungia desertarenae]
MSEGHEGRCLCEAVRLKVSGPLTELSFCHCSQCRRQTGLYYATTDVLMDKLSIEGEENVRWYRSSAKASRAFCGQCGSALFWHADGSPRIAVMAGVFDMPTGLSGGRHIYCEDKGDFYDLPQARDVRA